MAEVLQKLCTMYPDEPPMMVTCDPGHCFDLLSKDRAHTAALKHVLSLAKNLVKFVSIDQVDGIKKEMSEAMLIPIGIAKPENYPETRFNLAGDMLLDCKQQRPITNAICDFESFQLYYDSRPKATQDSLDESLDSFTLMMYQ
eukprot:4250536-Ditylum_brightwellii.AAC.1